MSGIRRDPGIRAVLPLTVGQRERTALVLFGEWTPVYPGIFLIEMLSPKEVHAIVFKINDYLLQKI